MEKKSPKVYGNNFLKEYFLKNKISTNFVATVVAKTRNIFSFCNRNNKIFNERRR